ncbi:UbiA family prenyltransferase [Alphaproteobacteria bacterium LSUCC0684]
MSVQKGKFLVVDLDGTLLRSDMLHESFWSALGRDWRVTIYSIPALIRGKASLKDYLQEASDIEVSLLPYNDEVIDYINRFRKEGGRVALVTATNNKFAQKIADYLDLFDEVHGSTADHNLKGKAKAHFLNKHFGNNSYVYMGDTEADLPVWKQSIKAVTVNASPSLRKKVESLQKPFEHIEISVKSPIQYLKAMRPHQWLKNILIFLPILVAHKINIDTFFASFIAFVSFCLVASSVYVLNDLIDLNADRTHPRKRFRPFASGSLSIAHGAPIVIGLIGTGVILSSFVNQAFLITLVLYFLLTTLYSLHLKSKIIIDVCMLAGLYTLRIFAGSVAVDIEISFWLMAFSVFIFLSLASVKRQAELVDMKERSIVIANGRDYHVEDLPVITMVAIISGYLSVLVMAMYVNSPEIVDLYSTPSALWGICCVLLYWITRIVLITHRGKMHDDPVVFAVKDKVSLICLFAILGFALLGWL